MIAKRPDPERLLAWLRRACIAGAVLVGILDAWYYRQWNLNPDGVSYLDLARAFLAHGPGALVNGYWSPLFPASIGAVLAIVSPEPGAMYPVVRGVGLITYLLAVVSYDRLVRAVMARHLISGPGESASHARDVRVPAAFVATAWALFYLLVSQAIGLQLATPDMGVAAIVFFVAAELLALGAAPWGLSRWLRLGIAFGFGYAWKAILFPVSGVAWLLAAGLALRRRDGWRGPAASAIAFGVLALLVAIPVSRAVGRLTFGETGRINHLWFVSRVPDVALLCRDPGERVEIEGIGRVPTIPVLTTAPLTCAMRDTVAEATLPIWYDPSPWFRNVHNRFDVAETVAAIRSDDGDVLPTLDHLASFSTIAVAAAVGGALVAAAFPVALAGSSAMAGYAVIPIVAYASVYVELRHIVPFILCLALWAVTTLLGRHRRIGAGVLALMLVAAVVDSTLRAVRQQRVEAAITLQELRDLPRPRQESSVVAEALVARGYRAGDRMAAVNAMWNSDWAQRAGFVVRAYVPEYTYSAGRAVAELSDECLRSAYVAVLRDHGIRALVLRKAPGVPVPGGFDAVEGTRYHVLDVSSAQTRPARCAP